MHKRFKAAGLAVVIAGGLLFSIDLASAQEVAFDCTKYSSEVAYFKGLRNKMTDEDLKDLGLGDANFRRAESERAAKWKLAESIRQLYPNYPSGELGSPEGVTEAQQHEAFEQAFKDPRVDALFKIYGSEVRAANEAYRRDAANIRAQRFSKQIEAAQKAYKDCVRNQTAAQRAAEREAVRQKEISDLEKARALVAIGLVIGMLEGPDSTPEIEIGTTTEGGTTEAGPEPELTKTQKETIRRLRQRVLNPPDRPQHDPTTSAIAAAAIGAAVGTAIKTLRRERTQQPGLPGGGGGGGGTTGGGTTGGGTTGGGTKGPCASGSCPR